MSHLLLGALPHKQTTDLYLLHGLIWCGLCDCEMAVSLATPAIRRYACANDKCPRRLVSAEETEQLVWKCFALRFETRARELERNERRTALHEAITRVTIYRGVNSLDFEWRD